MKIHACAEIISGYTFRGIIPATQDGTLCVLQARDIVDGVPIDPTIVLTTIDDNIPQAKSYLQPGDILLVARGTKGSQFRATYVSMITHTKILASSSVHIIRLKNTDLLPEYVSLYLNTKAGQKKLSEIMSGSHVAAIPRKSLLDLEIPFPPIHYQQTLLDLHTNLQQQREILRRQYALKQQILESLLSS